MSYSVRLKPEVARAINGLSLPPAAIRELLGAIDDLGRSPTRSLIRVGPPADSLQYDVVIIEDGPERRGHYFAFTVLYDADEETLHVVNLEYLFEDDPESP